MTGVRELLRFVACGHAGGGKSTLISRLLEDGQQSSEAEREGFSHDALSPDSWGAETVFAHLADELAAESASGVSKAEARRVFAIPGHGFIVAELPGAEQGLHKLLNSIVAANAALLLVDVQTGLLIQARRHTHICSLLGIRHLALVINKMDLVGFSRKSFQTVVTDFMQFSGELGFESVTPIPLSALDGDNLVERSPRSPWYDGPTLMDYLNTVTRGPNLDVRPLRLPVQSVMNRTDPDCCGYLGSLVSGRINVGDELRILPAASNARVERILLAPNAEAVATAQAGQAVTVVLDQPIDCVRGDVLVAAREPCDVADQFFADLFWFGEEEGFVGRFYLFKLGPLVINAQITEAQKVSNEDTLELHEVKHLERNTIGAVKIACDRPVPFEPYETCAPMGAFVLMDSETNVTVAAGMIRYALRRATNVHRQALTINQLARERLNGHAACVLWFTGLSGAGKSTIANALEQVLHARGVRTYILDGDNVRQGLNRDLGFSDADRVENIRRIAEVARLMVDAGLVVLTAFISPFRTERNHARTMFGEGQFFEIYVDTSLAVAEQRDPKGLYAKARRGDLPHFTSIDSLYEPPLAPECRLDTVAMSVDESVARLMGLINMRLSR